MKNLIKGIAVGLTALALSTGAAMAEPLKVGFLYLGTPGDHGWTYAHELARQKVEAHFGDKVETTFVEMFLKVLMLGASPGSLPIPVTRLFLAPRSVSWIRC